MDIYNTSGELISGITLLTVDKVESEREGRLIGCPSYRMRQGTINGIHRGGIGRRCTVVSESHSTRSDQNRGRSEDAEHPTVNKS